MAAPKKKAEEIVEEAKQEFLAEDLGPEQPPIEYPAQIETYPPKPYPQTANSVPGVYAAMVSAQSEIGNIVKNAKNPHFKSKFVDLAQATEAIIPILNKNGLFVVQGVYSFEGNPTLDTTIYHTDGSSIGGYSYPLVSKDKDDPQKLGASMTYARRYSLMAAVGAAPEDDDGNSAAKPPAEKKDESKAELLKKLQAMKATPEKFKEIATKAKVTAEKYNDLTADEAKKMLAVVDNSVPF